MATVVALALVVGWQVAQGVGPTTVQQAERLAREGRTREALEHFERIVSEQPEDVDARVWIARLLNRLGWSSLAEQEFRLVLMRAPDRVDALVGLADTLCNRGECDEASELLDRAERLAPQSAEVLASRGRALQLAGRWTAAEAYYSQASVVSPDDRDIEQRLRQLQRLNRHRVEGSFQHERVSGVSSAAAYAGDIAIDLRATDSIRFAARAQAQNRFSRQEARMGGGIEWRPRPNLTVRGSSLFGPGAELIARTDTAAEVEGARGRMEFSAGVRGITFATARVYILGPAATIWLNDRTSLTTRYYASRTSVAERPAALHHSGLARLRYNMQPRLWLDVGYSRGYESIDTLSSDRLGSFRADTLSGGVLWHLTGHQSIATSLEYQWQSNARTMVRVTAAVIQRF